MTQPFPDDELRRLVRWLVRVGGLLEPHDHAGVRASASEVFAVGELVESGPLSQQQLGERLGLEKSTVSRLAAGLERRGWLERVRDPANRRYYQLRLTADGVAAAVTIGAALHRHHHDLLGGLTAQERAGLLLGLSGLARVIESHRRPAAGGPPADQRTHPAGRPAPAG